MKFKYIFILIIINWNVLSQDLNPHKFNDISRHTNIFETYLQYRELFGEKRQKKYDSTSNALINKDRNVFIFLESKSIIPEMNSTDGGNHISVATNYGSLNGLIQKSYYALEVSYLIGNIQFGFNVFEENVGVNLESYMNPGMDSIFLNLSNKNNFGFFSGQSIITCLLNYNDNEVAVGILHRETPLVAFDSSQNSEIFFIKKKSDNTFTGTSDGTEVFLNYRFKSYSFNSLISSNRLNHFGLILHKNIHDYINYDGFLNYSKYKTRIKMGANFKENYFEKMENEIEISNEIHKQSQCCFGYYFHIISNNRFYLFKILNSTLSSFSNYDFHIILNYTYSISSDIFEKIISGHSGGISFEDIFGLLSVKFGVGYNDYKYLTIFPVENSLILELKLQFAW